MKNTERLSNNGPLISVLVPVYNVENYLDCCLNSIINQTYSNLQIILVDDGSLDTSGRICDAYAATDSRIEVIHKQNGGLVTARKAGLALAKGEYTGFVDGDDYIEHTFYEYLADCIINSGADFVHGGYREERISGSRMCTPFYVGEVAGHADKMALIKNSVICIEETDYVWSPSIWSKLFRTEFIQNCYEKVPDYQSYGEDMLVFCRCILDSKKFVSVQNYGYHYRIREESLSRKWNAEKFWQESSLCRELCSIWREYGHDTEMMTHMDQYLLLRMIECMNQINRTGLGTVKYALPDIELIKGKRVVIYGAGPIGRDYISQLLGREQYCIVAWADRKFKNVTGVCVSRERLKDLDYDIVLIAVEKESTAEEIKKELIETGIAVEQILWKKPVLHLNNRLQASTANLLS